MQQAKIAPRDRLIVALDLPSVEAAEAIGARPILVRTGTGNATARAMDPGRVEVFDDFGAAARALLAEQRR